MRLAAATPRPPRTCYPSFTRNCESSPLTKWLTKLPAKRSNRQRWFMRHGSGWSALRIPNSKAVDTSLPRRRRRCGASSSTARDKNSRSNEGRASGELEFWSVPEGTRLERSVRHKDVIWTTRFSPDERLLLTASRDRTAALWEAETGRLVREFRHEQQVLTAAFSPD